VRPLVLDASAALAYLLGEPDGERVERELDARQVVLVPWIFWTEIINVLSRRRRWPGIQVLPAVHDLERFGITTEPPSRQRMMAVIDAVEAHGLSAYDAEYVVLAELADADLLTGDAVLAGVAGIRAIRIGAHHRLAGQTVGYPQRTGTADAGWPHWPGAAAYLAELRREAASELEALRASGARTPGDLRGSDR
jgi:predicted nucleic acid-binding protein